MAVRGPNLPLTRFGRGGVLVADVIRLINHLYEYITFEDRRTRLDGDRVPPYNFRLIRMNTLM